MLKNDTVFLGIYKSTISNCCKKIAYLHRGSDEANTPFQPNDLKTLKTDEGFSAHNQFFHTVISNDDSVYESHISIDVIQHFFTPPSSIMASDRLGMVLNNHQRHYCVGLLSSKDRDSIYRRLSRCG